MSDAAFKEMMVSLHPVYPSLIDPNGDIIHRAVIRDPEQRAAPTEELQVASLQDRVFAYAKAVIESLDLNERIQAAAPTLRKRRNGTPPKNANPFCYVVPQIVPSRHQFALEWSGRGNFFETARAMARR